jgi:hypothetical protein
MNAPYTQPRVLNLYAAICHGYMLIPCTEESTNKLLAALTCIPVRHLMLEILPVN